VMGEAQHREKGGSLTAALSRGDAGEGVLPNVDAVWVAGASPRCVNNVPILHSRARYQDEEEPRWDAPSRPPGIRHRNSTGGNGENRDLSFRFPKSFSVPSVGSCSILFFGSGQRPGWVSVLLLTIAKEIESEPPRHRGHREAADCPSAVIAPNFSGFFLGVLCASVVGPLRPFRVRVSITYAKLNNVALLVGPRRLQRRPNLSFRAERGICSGTPERRWRRKIPRRGIATAPFD